MKRFLVFGGILLTACMVATKRPEGLSGAPPIATSKVQDSSVEISEAAKSKRLLFFDVIVDPSLNELASKSGLLSRALQNDLVGRGLKIIDRSTRDTLMLQRKFKIEDCNKQECRFAIAKGLPGVDLMLESLVESAGANCAVSLTVKDVRTGLVVGSTFKESGCAVDELIPALKESVYSMRLNVKDS